MKQQCLFKLQLFTGIASSRRLPGRFLSHSSQKQSCFGGAEYCKINTLLVVHSWSVNSIKPARFSSQLAPICGEASLLWLSYLQHTNKTWLRTTEGTIRKLRTKHSVIRNDRLPLFLLQINEIYGRGVHVT